MPSARSLLAVLSLAALAAVSTESPAQSLADRLKKKAEEAAKKKLEGTKPAPAKADTAKSAEAESDAAASPEAEKPGAGEAAAAPDVPGKGAWANYDFKPGERILYVDDFTKDEVGDFPKRMEFQQGALEIVEWKGTRYLRAAEDSRFYIVLPEVLPERFTIEFDYMIPSRGEVWISFGEENKRAIFGGMGNTGVYNAATKITASARSTDQNEQKLRRARIMGDGKYLKVYLDDQRTLNVPNADVGRATKILFYTDANAEKPALFGNFRVAAGGKKLYESLTEKGRVATQGIYFDTGSDRIRGESTPTLKEIGQMLQEHPELTLTIEGHTDNVGNAAANLALSEKRAAAVRQYLIDSHGVDAARLKSAGHGAAKPAATNDTPEGRQTNRRVELVKG